MWEPGHLLMKLTCALKSNLCLIVDVPLPSHNRLLLGPSSFTACWNLVMSNSDFMARKATKIAMWTVSGCHMHFPFSFSLMSLSQ